MAWLKNNLKRLLLVLALAGAAFFGAQKLRGPVVEVAAVQEGPIEQSIVVSGRVQAPNRVEIGSVIKAEPEFASSSNDCKNQGLVGQFHLLLQIGALRTASYQCFVVGQSLRIDLYDLGHIENLCNHRSIFGQKISDIHYLGHHSAVIGH